MSIAPRATPNAFGPRAPDAASQQHGIEHRATTIDFPDHRVAVEFDAVEIWCAWPFAESTSRTASWLHAAGILGHGKQGVMPSASSSEPDVRAATTIILELLP